MKTNVAAEQRRMEREYSRLNQCYSNFTRLKQEISRLVAHSASDPAAARKLSDLQALIPGGISELEHQAGKDMQALSVAVKQLQSQLKNIVTNR